MKLCPSILRPWHLALPFILSSSIASLAAEIQWTGEVSQNWNDPVNWAGGAFPLDPNDATINIATGNFPIISADSMFQTRDTIVGRGAAGRVDHRAGIHSTNSGNWTYIGQGANGSGTYNLADTSTPDGGVSGFAQGSGTLNFGGRLYIGTTFDGAGDATPAPVGVMNINTTGSLLQGATGNDQGIYVGDGGGTGTLNLQSGTIVAHDFYIGKGGNAKGTMNMTGGTVTANQWMNVGDSNGGGDGTGQGTLNMSGGTLNQNHTDFFSFGQSGGKGTFNMSGGLLNDPAVVDTGTDFGTEGKHFKGNVTIGRFDGPGLGIWNISGTAELNVRDLRLAENAASTGILNVSGGTINQANGQTLIGENGVGIANISGGTVNLRRIIAGDGAGATGTITVTGGELRSTANEIWLGQGGGVATMTHSGGLVTANSWIAIGRDHGTGTYDLSGTGRLEKTGGNNSHVVIGSVLSGGDVASIGTLNQSGGTFTTAGNGDVWLGEIGMGDGAPWPAAATGIWNFSGGVADVDAVRVGYARGGSGQLTVSGTASLTATELVVSQGGPGSVTQSGGTIHTTGNVDIQAGGGNGTYTLSGGTLSVDGTLDLSDGTFAFTGGAITRSNEGTIFINGDLTTGNRAATLRLDDGKTFEITGTLNKTVGLTLDLTGLTIPAYDGVGIDTGSFTLGSVGSILGDFGPELDALVGLINNAGAVFISEAQGKGATFDPVSQSVFWVQEEEGTVSLQYSVVPEPGTASLLALAFVGFASRRRRQ